VQAHLDSLSWMRNTSLVANGGRQELAGWRRLAKGLERALRDAPTRPNPHGWSLAGLGAGLTLAAALRLAADPTGVVESWRLFFLL
jgi:hypothetical protein